MATRVWHETGGGKLDGFEPWEKRWIDPLSQPENGFLGIELRNGLYWLSPTDAGRYLYPQDIGPFHTFEAAAACFETLI
ncbi:MAG: hypothetical protein ACYC36_02540 [Bellilinea sp.]